MVVSSSVESRYGRICQSKFNSLLVFGIYPGQPWAASQTEYYEGALFNPSTGILLAENRGRVSIYDGLEHAVVDRAMDTQFDRIGNMMFIRTRQTLPDGSVESDDDCD